MAASDSARLILMAVLLRGAACAAAEISVVEGIDPGIAQLVAELDHIDFSFREGAEAALVARGTATIDELRGFYDDESPEIRFRVRRIVTRVEAAKFSGRWQLIRWESAGKAEEGQENIIEIRSDAWLSQGNAFSYSLNPLVSPAEIDLNFAGSTWCGIYHFDGDLMVLAIRKPGQGRPAGFVTSPADSTILHTRRRLNDE
jgi:uncharacterized protein (TIGR03067 family)